MHHLDAFALVKSYNLNTVVPAVTARSCWFALVKSYNLNPKLPNFS
jgi:hypothetical protein